MAGEEENSLVVASSEVPALSESERKEILDKQVKDIISQVVTEENPDKVKDLTYLFNVNQKKISMMRAAKLNELLDAITDQALVRFTERPDNISNQELLASLKTVQDSIEKHQKQIVGDVEEQTNSPLIQINQQTNEVNVGTDTSKLDRSARERIKNTVLSILNNATKAAAQEPEIIETEPVEAAVVEDSQAVEVETVDIKAGSNEIIKDVLGSALLDDEE